MVGRPGFSGVKSGMHGPGMFSVVIRPLPIIVAGEFFELAKGVRSFREPLKRSIKQVVIPSIRKNFDQEGRPSWTILAPSTMDSRESQGYDVGPILDRSGKGKRAALAQARWKFTTDTAWMGGNFPPGAEYMPIHQIADTEDVFGGVGGSAYIPGRPFAVIQEEDQSKIDEVFARWFTERAAKAGLPAI